MTGSKFTGKPGIIIPDKLWKIQEIKLVLHQSYLELVTSMLWNAGKLPFNKCTQDKFLTSHAQQNLNMERPFNILTLVLNGSTKTQIWIINSKFSIAQRKKFSKRKNLKPNLSFQINVSTLFHNNMIKEAYHLHLKQRWRMLTHQEILVYIMLILANSMELTQKEDHNNGCTMLIEKP